jgi:hypothetical protein
LLVVVEAPEAATLKDDVFRFAHLSVQEYCETSIWSHAEVHAFAAKVGITRLLDWKTLETFQRSEECTGYFITKLVELGGDFGVKILDSRPHPISWRRPVTAAIETRSTEVLKYVLDHGGVAFSTDLFDAFRVATFRDRNGAVVLRAVAEWRIIDSLIRVLLEHGCDPNKTHSGEKIDSNDSATPLIMAAALGLSPVCRTLCEFGADVNLQASRGYYSTALLAAVNCRNIGTVAALLECGADPTMQLSEKILGMYSTVLGYVVLTRSSDDKFRQMLVKATKPRNAHLGRDSSDTGNMEHGV